MGTPQKADSECGANPKALMNSKPDNNSYAEVIKSSTLIGVASLLNIGFSILRTKAMALLLGPSGVGLLGLYGSIVDLTRSLT